MVDVPKDFVVEALEGLKAWAADPSSADALAECQGVVNADASEGKVDSKKWILQRMIWARCTDKPDSRLACFQEDQHGIQPLWDALQTYREDPEVDKLYEQVKALMG